MTMSDGESSENLTAYRFRWIGYGFLVFALIDLIHILLTAPYAQPTWMLQTIGQFVERAVVPILGFTLVFFGEFYGRKPGEKLGLRILSWLSLLLAILFFLMVPSVAFQSFGLRSQADQQVTTAVEQGTKQVEQQLAQLNTLEAQLGKSSPAEITRLANQLSGLGVSVDPNKPEAVKSQIQARIKTVREQLQAAKVQGTAQLQQQAAAQVSNVTKNAVKWALGAIVAGALFVYLWKSSGWAR